MATKSVMCLAVMLGMLAAGAASATAQTVPVRVKVGKTVLRLAPSFKAAPVAEAAEGDVLQKTGIDGRWVQVAPPTNVAFWIHATQLKAGVVSSVRAKVRAGPGVDQLAIDELERGESVTIRGEQDEWVKIAPPNGCVLWVHETLVVPLDPDDPRAGQASGRKRIAPAGVEGSGVSGVPGLVSEGVTGAPPALVQLGLVPLDGQGRSVQYSGILVAAGYFSSGPAQFKMVRDEDGKRVEACNILGNKAQLTRLTGRRLIVTGREYWVKGGVLPFIVLERIQIRAEGSGEGKK